MRQIALARFVAAITAVGALSPSISTAQQPQQAKSLQFEVASIRPGNPRLGVSSWSSTGPPGGRFLIVNMPLRQWVEMGLSVRDYALKAPSWLDTSKFDLDADYLLDGGRSQKYSRNDEIALGRAIWIEMARQTPERVRL